MIVTFYSFKGGVGRSMALANVAEILGRNYRVLVCDWDLEAPGLERYFAPDATAAEKMKSWPGVMDLVQEYKRTLTNPEAAADATEASASDFHVLNGLRLRRPSSYAQQPVGSCVRLLTAGRRDGEFARGYTDSVQQFDWTAFYRDWAGGPYIEFLRKELEDGAQIVLVDSRTGVTEQGGVCTHHLADMVIVLTAPNDLNLNGTRWMLDALKRPELVQLRGGRQIAAVPVASRVEQTSEDRSLIDFRRDFKKDFEPYVEPHMANAGQFLEESEIPYIPFYAFTERVVARSKEGERNAQLYRSYDRIASAIVAWGEEFGLLKNGQDAKPSATKVLLSFAGPDRTEAEALKADFEKHGMIVLAANDAPLPELRRMVAEANAAVILLSGSGAQALDTEIRLVLARNSLEPRFRVITALSGGARATRALNLFEPFPLVDLRASEVREGAVERCRQLIAAPPVASGTAHVRTPPFRGLAAYRGRDAVCFWGRDADIARLVKMIWLETVPVLLTGPSAVGKSSLVSAGAIPELTRGNSFGAGIQRACWRIEVLDCNAAPSPEDLATVLERISPKSTDASPGLLVVTGLRALFATQAQRDLWIDLVGKRIVPAALARSVRLLIVARPDAAKTIADAGIQGAVCPLAAMQPDDLRDAITRPPALAGASVEPALVEALLHDAANPPRLWFVQLALQQLWEQRTGSSLTIGAYQALGGSDGVLQRHAGAGFQQLGKADQDLARLMILRLVALGEGMEDLPRPADIEEILGIGDSPSEAARVADTLIAVRLAAVSDDGRSLELAHPGLIRGWPELQSWIAAERDSLRLESRLREDARKWNSSKDKRLLYRGGALAEAEDWMRAHASRLRDYERGFVQAGARARQRRTWLVVVGAVLAVILATAGAFSFGKNLLIDAGAIPPDRYTGHIEEPFLLGGSAEPDPALWQVPPAWSIVKGDGLSNNDGALRVTGSGMGLLRIPARQALYDFDAGFRVRFIGKAAWILRAQRGGRVGYLFELRTDGGTLYLAGYLLRDGVRQQLAAQAVVANCCLPSDGIEVTAKVSGSSFVHMILIQPMDLSDSRPYAFEQFAIEMKDPSNTFRWGTIGFSETATDPAAGMTVAYVAVKAR